MAHLTRRGFIQKSSVGVATVGALATVPGLAAAHAASQAPALDAATASKQGPLVAHVRDYAKGEIALLVGTREVIVRDPELVARLVRAAR